jgi:hypothetical protein
MTVLESPLDIANRGFLQVMFYYTSEERPEGSQEGSHQYDE